MSLTEQQTLQCLMQARTRLSAAAWLVVRDTHAAEDIFQNVALKAVTRDVEFETEGAVLSWAFITARREGIDWLRRHQREVVGLEAEVLELLERDGLNAKSASAGARTKALEDCLASVPAKARDLLSLRYVEGCSCEEAGARLGLTLAVVYKRLSRLHQALRECIEGKLAAPTHSP